MPTTSARHEIRASTSSAAEDDLSALWRELAAETPAARAVMSNLVVFRERPEAEEVDVCAALRDGLVVEVARAHPSRVIVLVHARGNLECRTGLPAAVGILTFGPEGARHAIEQIAVRSQGLEQSLPSIVRRLVLGDLPTSVWWLDDLSVRPPLAELATMGRQFVYDSREWRDVRGGLATVAALLEHRHAPDLADLNWRRLAPLRQGVAHGLAAAGLVAAGPGRPGPGDASAIEIRLQHAPGEEAAAWLMAGWLTSRLEPPAGPGLKVTVSPDAAAAQRMVIAVATAGTGGFTVTIDDHQVEAASPADQVPWQMAVAAERAADAVAAELWTLGHDVALAGAVRAALARLD
ncbi:MAG: glucose-6-phosphate dehydrogenase assembly protein OpcA [Acidobacteriota bacterium]